tara:strand:+ start:222 stop:548 length:327 start_codon:yes stop_codon:yes gene_type:complete
MNQNSKLFQTLSIVFLISIGCTSTNDSDLEAKLEKILDNQKVILSRLDKLEKSQRDLALKVNTPAKPSQANNRPKVDPNKVYDIPIGNSMVLGNPAAKVTIMEWMDFQ